MSEFLKVTKLSDRQVLVLLSNGWNINGSDSGISSFTHTGYATEPQPIQRNTRDSIMTSIKST